MQIAARFAVAAAAVLLTATAGDAAAPRTGRSAGTVKARLAGDGKVLARAPVDPATAVQLALAMDILPEHLVSADLLGSDPVAAGIGTTRIGRFFPRQGATFAILSSGEAASATLPDEEGDLSAVLGGPDNSQGEDLVQLKLVLQPPAGATCLGFDFVFYSEEFPEFVGSEFNDFFIAEMGASDFTFTGGGEDEEPIQVVAPRNFAFDLVGRVISVNTTFGVSANTATTYDGGTLPLRAVGVLGDTGGGPVTIFLTISDLGDSIYDSTVFLDNFVWIDDPACTAGAQFALGALSPGSFFITPDQEFDAVIFDDQPAVLRSGTLNDADISGALATCIPGVRVDGQGTTLRCPGVGGGGLSHAFGLDPFIVDLTTVFTDASVKDDLTVWQYPDASTPKFVILPTSNRFASTQQFDLVLLFGPEAGFPLGLLATLDQQDVSAELFGCAFANRGIGFRGAYTFRCPLPAGFLAPGSHVVEVAVFFDDGTAASNRVTWEIIPVVE
jgi:hypothetical protein